MEFVALIAIPGVSFLAFGSVSAVGHDQPALDLRHKDPSFPKLSSCLYSSPVGRMWQLLFEYVMAELLAKWQKSRRSHLGSPALSC
jgi:hypothetical protein